MPREKLLKIHAANRFLFNEHTFIHQIESIQ